MNLKNNQLSLALGILSILMLIPGLLYPMLTISLDGSVDASMAKMNLQILNKTASILQTVKELFEHNNKFVAIMIFFFSVIVPLLKAGIFFKAYFTKDLQIKTKLINFIKRIGKWSMADVFVVGIFLAYLSTRNQPTESVHQASVMGFNLKIQVLVNLQSQLEIGFYFFLAYCVLSLLSMELFKE